MINTGKWPKSMNRSSKILVTMNVKYQTWLLKAYFIPTASLNLKLMTQPGSSRATPTYFEASVPNLLLFWYRQQNRKNALADTICTMYSAFARWCEMVIKNRMVVRCRWLGIVWFLHREPWIEADTMGFYYLWRLVRDRSKEPWCNRFFQTYHQKRSMNCGTLKDDGNHRNGSNTI